MPKLQAAPRILELGPEFYDAVRPAIFPRCVLRYRNQNAAAIVGLEGLSETEWQRHFCQFVPLPQNLAEPLALRYHGHQFMHYNPDLGDGRGFLFAQIEADGKLYDLGTKGSGQTPYSRQGDGRLTLKGAVREILATEMLESLGVNTSKTFSVFETGESLIRYDEPSPTRSAVLVRLNHSHIRIGTFQRLAHIGDPLALRRLLNYCVKYYDTEIRSQEDGEKASQFFANTVRRMAFLSAEWMIAGFVHGVLNSDNMNISGESFDYGPYRFLPHYDPQFTAAYFDQQGLYSFGRQPITTVWNLRQLGTALQVAFPELAVEDILQSFSEHFNLRLHERFFRRLNLKAHGDERDEKLMMNFYRFLSVSHALHEQSFFDLFAGARKERLQGSPQTELYQGEDFAQLESALSSYQLQNPALLSHPYAQTSRACSLLIDEIEAIWSSIAEKDDWSLFSAKIDEIRSVRGFYF